MADIVKDILDKSARQRKIVFQQKKPLLNYELNLAQDILKEGLEDFIKVSIGDNYSGESLQVVPSSLANEVFIKKGIFYHKGTPVYLPSDKRLDLDAPPSSGIRFDVVYATWRLVQVDSEIDPVIGFATTQEQLVELNLNYETNTAVPTTVPQETIVFSAADNSISLTRGQFPDWLRVVGTKFRTNAINNTGSPYLTVASSPNDKKIIVQQTIVDQTTNDVRFSQYGSSYDIVPKEFRAFRDNVIILAVLERTAGETAIKVNDKRPAVANNYVVSGCAPFKNGTLAALEVGLTPGEFLVGGNKEFLEDTSPWVVNLINNALNYIYIGVDGEPHVDVTEPLNFCVMLAEVRVKDGLVQETPGGIPDINDVRKFRPTSSGGGDNESNGSGSGLTGFTTVSNDFTAGETILAYDLVYVDTNSRVYRATASSNATVPAIGIAYQNTMTGEKNPFVTYGVISNPAWNWNAGEDLFLDTATGKITNGTGVALFTTGQYVQRIGVAINSKEVFFAPDLTTIKVDATAEIPLIVLRPNGDLEIMGPEDRISPDRLNFLASAAQSPNVAGFDLLPGRYYVNNNVSKDFAGLFVNMGSSGTTYRTTAIDSGYYNKAFFTLDLTGTVKMYEGIPSDTLLTLLDPVVPDGEIPLSIITFRDNGAGLPGTIHPITRENILDKRPWLNLGNYEDTAFQAIYRTKNKVLVQRGEAWISKKYVTLQQNVEITVPTVDGDYYFYLNITEDTNPLSPTYFPHNEPNLTAVVNANHFVATTNLPTQVARRDYILLAQYSVASGEIVRNTFRTFRSRFWDFQDIPFYGERKWLAVGADKPQSFVYYTNNTTEPDYTSPEMTFQFTGNDYLEVMINGDQIFEPEDYTKYGWDDPNYPNGVVLNFDLLEGAELRIRKI